MGPRAHTAGVSGTDPAPNRCSKALKGFGHHLLIPEPTLSPHGKAVAACDAVPAGSRTAPAEPAEGRPSVRAVQRSCC